MKAKILPVFCFVLLSTSFLFAQSVQEIMHSGQYYYGSGTSFDEKEALDHALNELTSQIAVNVASSFERILKEKGKQLQDKVKSIMRTHSAATLKDVKIIKQPLPDGRIKVFCYLAKSEMNKIYQERRKLIFEMYRKAQQNEDLYNYATALKLYYFALLLTNSIPDQNVIYQGINFTTELPEKINRLMNAVQFQLVNDQLISKDEREITLKMTANGQPVSLLDFRFWDGSHQVSVRGKDGLATFQLLGASVKFKELQINIKYAYYDARREYQVIDQLWDVVTRPVFNVSRTVKLTASPSQTLPSKVSTMSAKKWNLKLEYKNDVPVAKQIMQSTLQFLNLIQSKDKARIRQQYGDDSFLRDKILRYIEYNHPKPLDKTIDAQIHKTASGYELRRIRMLHRYPSIHEQSNEYLVLDFSDKGKLVDLNVSITERLYNKFVEKSKFAHDWKRRQQIIKFMERYRTAYLTRDLKTVDLMFAEDALILVGRKIMKKKLADRGWEYHKFGNEPDYKFIKLSKHEYLQRLHRVFQAQQDIFLNFSSFDIIRKNNQKNVYGVEMRQGYHSTTYSDEGYLFLLIDFNHRDPLIFVRAWQPHQWDDSSLVRTSNFVLQK